MHATAPLVRRAAPLVPFVLLCLQLQVHSVALGPVLTVIARDAGLTLAQAGALTSIPVFCSAALTPVAARVIASTGTNVAMVLAAGGSGVAVLLRSSGPVPALFAGSVLLGVAIALANIAIPTLITRRYRSRALLVSSVQTSSTNVGSAAAALASAPLVAALGWQRGLAVWAVLSFGAAAVWWWRHGLAATARDERPPVTDVAEALAEATGAVPPAPAAGGRPVRGWRVPLAWVLGVACLLHGTCYFAASSWMPLLLQERSGLSANAAGACVAVFMALGVVGPLLLAPMLRLPGLRLWMLMTATSVGWLVCMVLLATAPGLWLAAVLVGGLVQGACFTVIVTFAVHVAAGEAQSREIQATLQTVGFTGAALAPIAIGAVLDATGAWTIPLAVLVAVAAALVAVGALASRMLVAHDAHPTTSG